MKAIEEKAREYVQKYADHGVDSLYYALGNDLNLKTLMSCYKAGYEECLEDMKKDLDKFTKGFGYEND